jgi:P pilus assembly chaperone PapD
MKLRLILAVVLACTPGLRAQQGGIYLSPTVITLDRGTGIGTLTVRNDTTRPVVFQVRGFLWSNGPDGNPRLESTDDLVVYPTTLTMEPRESRRIRIGSQVQAGARERAYRIILDEVPPSVPAAGSALATRVARVDMAAPEVSGGVLHLAIANSGPIHVTPQRVEARGLDAAGSVVWTRTFKPWYLLAGETRRHDAVLSASQCRGAARVVAEAVFAEGSKLTLREERALTGTSCNVD